MKKVLLVSDSHWSDELLEDIIKKHGAEVDMVIHCGDIRMSPEYLQKIAPVPVYLVKGNNDFSSTAESEYILEIEGHKCLVTHGHRHYIKEGYRYLADYAKTKEADIVFYGHTHMHDIRTVDGVLLINPGTLEAIDYATYMIVDFRDDGEVEAHLQRAKMPDVSYSYEQNFEEKKHRFSFREFLKNLR